MTKLKSNMTNDNYLYKKPNSKFKMSLEQTTMMQTAQFEETLLIDLKSIINTAKIHDQEYTKKIGLKVSSYDGYDIVRYDKGLFSSVSYDITGIMRSVIFCNEEVVCFSPTKSVDLSCISAMEHTYCDESPRLEEFVDGTMINAFYHKNKWQISTRSVLGANTTFYNDMNRFPKTYKQMFDDCLKETNFKLDNLDPKYCYSFVIKHPENRIVEKIHEPSMYLCAVYRIEGTKVYNIPMNSIVSQNQEKKMEFNPELEIMFRNSTVRVPFVDLCHTVEEAFQIYANPNSTPYETRGILIKLGNMRAKIYNPNYEHVRNLRGNQSKLQYKFYEFRQSNTLSEYLKYFPEHNFLFQILEEEVKYFQDILYLLYCEVYIFKRLNIELVPYEYKNHVRNIHSFYIMNLNLGRKESIHKNNVIYYTYKLQPAMLMFTINYSKHSHSNKPHQMNETKIPVHVCS